MKIDPLEGIVLADIASLIQSTIAISNNQTYYEIKTFYCLGRYKLVMIQKINLDQQDTPQSTRFELYSSPNFIYGLKNDIQSYTNNETKTISDICKYGSDIDKLYNLISWLKLQYEIDFKKTSHIDESGK